MRIIPLLIASFLLGATGCNRSEPDARDSTDRTMLPAPGSDSGVAAASAGCVLPVKYASAYVRDGVINLFFGVGTLSGGDGGEGDA